MFSNDGDDHYVVIPRGKLCGDGEEEGEGRGRGWNSCRLHFCRKWRRFPLLFVRYERSARLTCIYLTSRARIVWRETVQLKRIHRRLRALCSLSPRWLVPVPRSGFNFEAPISRLIYEHFSSDNWSEILSVVFLRMYVSYVETNIQ